MRKNLKMVSFLITILVSSASGQHPPNGKGTRVILSVTTGMENIFLHIYQPSFLAKAIFNDTTQAVNLYPEQLMSSVISTQYQEWIDYNTLGGREKSDTKEQRYFDFIKTMDKNRNYFELKSKLTFSLNGNDFSIIKFYFHTEFLPNPQTGAYVMQKVNNRWYTTSTPYTTEIALMMMRFREDKLLKLLQARPNGERLHDELLKIVAPTGVMEFSLLYREFSKWYNENDILRKEYFIDQNAW